MSDRSADAIPQWWPRGADEQLVRECNCDHCALLAEKLEEHRAGIAPDGETRTIDNFAQT